MTRASLLLVLTLLVLPGCSGERTLRTADGRQRTYRVHVPARRSTPTPVVLVLHGGGGNAEGTQKAMGLDALADAQGFLAVYPNGTGKKVLGKLFATWNSDEQCCGDALKDGVDDVAFISALIERPRSTWPTEPSRSAPPTQRAAA